MSLSYDDNLKDVLDAVYVYCLYIRSVLTHLASAHHKGTESISVVRAP
jgi:hypothetical protein